MCTSFSLPLSFVEQFFPVHALPRSGDGDNDAIIVNPSTHGGSGTGAPLPSDLLPIIPELKAMKDGLHTAIEALPLPANFLDVLIEALGGPSKVAEMTGRKGRITRVSGRLTYELRARPETSDMDSLNVRER